MAIRVLFICVHNSARSQMAEAFLKRIGGDKFIVESAGLEPGALNPRVVTAMQEIGIDISGNPTKGVHDLLKQGRAFNVVVTVCDESSAERCPIFPGVAMRLHWSFADPSAFTGTEEEKLEQTRAVRDAIERAVKNFVAELREKDLAFG